MARIQYLTQIEIDHGAVRCLPAECERIGMRKPLVVSDAGVRAAGVLDRALAALPVTAISGVTSCNLRLEILTIED